MTRFMVQSALVYRLFHPIFCRLADNINDSAKYVLASSPYDGIDIAIAEVRG